MNSSDYQIASRGLHLHGLSWCALVLVLLAMTIIVLPGAPDISEEYVRRSWIDWHGVSQGPWTEYEYIVVQIWNHGWPMEYLRRPLGDPAADFRLHINGEAVFWSSPDAWVWKGKAYYFSWAWLFIDIVAGLIVVIAATAVCEFWRRRRRPYRVSLLDIGVFSTGVCLTLGWYQAHALQCKREQAVLGDAKGIQEYRNGFLGVAFKSVPPKVFCAPLWLKRLLGARWELLPGLHHANAVEIEAEALSSEQYSELKKLCYVTVVNCRGKLRPDLVHELSKLPLLNALRDARRGGYSADDPPPAPMVQSGELDLLRKLPHLNSLDLGVSLSVNDLKELSRLPHLENLSFFSNSLLIEDLPMLESFPKLKSVNAQILALDEELEDFRDRHPNLRFQWDRHRKITEWQVLQARLSRWRGDAPSKKRARYPEENELDLYEITLTADRLTKIPVDLSSVDSLTLGDADNPDLAVELINRCGPLLDLYAVKIPLTRSHLEAISSQLDGLIVELQQGELTLLDLTWLAEQLNPETRCIVYGATLSTEEAQRLDSVFKKLDVYIEFYRGMEIEPEIQVNP